MFCELSSIIGPPKVNAFQLQSCRLMELCGWCDFRGWMHKNVIVFSSSKEVIFWDSASTGFLFYLYLSNSGVSIYVSELNYLTTSHSGDGRDLIHPESAVILNSSNGVSSRAIHQRRDIREPSVSILGRRSQQRHSVRWNTWRIFSVLTPFSYWQPI